MKHKYLTKFLEVFVMRISLNILIISNYITKVIKGKGRPTTAHEGLEEKCRYTSTLSLTSALDGVGG